MIKWLKFTFGSYFSNKLSKEAKSRSLWNFLFALFFSYIITLSFIVLSFSVSFPTHYNNADNFKEVTNNIFAHSDSTRVVNLKINNPNSDTSAKAIAYMGDDESKLAYINTFDNIDHFNTYSLHGYNIIIDTRDSATSFVEFEVSYVNIDDKTLTVTADGFRELNSTDKQKYTADLKLTDDVITLTDELTTANKTWLGEYFAKLTDEQKNGNTLFEEYERIKENGSKEEIYSLYTRVYYSINQAPNIVSYYQNTYAVMNDDGSLKYNNYFIITDIWSLVSFTTNNGVNCTYDGFYHQLDNGFAIHTPQTNSKEIISANVDKLILSIYNSASGFKTINYAVSLFRFMPFVLISLVVIPLFTFGICKIKKHSYADRFVDSFKITSSHYIMSSILAGIVALIASFFVGNSTVFMIGAWGSLLLVVLRQFIFVIVEEVYLGKHPEENVINVTPVTANNNVTTSTTKKEKLVLDNKPIDMKSKVIKNENVDDDEEETMDFM